MSSPGSGHGDAQRQQARVENRREREFYEYYDALERLSGVTPAYLDLADPEALRRHVPLSSPDKALTTFCQLGALQLRAKRGLLFFFSSVHAFILAEATPTLSLQDPSRYKDELWVGFARIDRSQSVCEYTVQMPPILSDDSAAKSSVPLNIIPDLRERKQFCNLPYVTNAPNMRFYAGVPITTAKGINIGAYCVLDSDPREGLKDQEQKFMREMAVTVMEHLEGIRAKADSERGAQMVEALDSFIQGSSDSRTQKHKANRMRLRGRSVRTVRSPLSTQQTPDPPGATIDNKKSTDQSSPGPHAGAVKATMPNGGNESEDKRRSDSDPASTVSKHADGQSKASSHGDELHAAATSSTLKQTFQRASNLLQRAIDVDEIIFLDGTVNSFSGLAKDLANVGETFTDSETNATDSEDPPDAGGSQSWSQVLGKCHVPSDTTPSRPYSAANGVSESLLRSLLRRYPHGNIWNLGYADNSESSDDSSREIQDIGSARTLAEATSTKVTPSSRRARNRRSEVAELRRLFPEARSLALYGLWDHARKRWYAACMLWTSSPTRLFVSESEMNFVAAFCDVITEEIHRQEIEKSDKAKQDFIASISHELRSPLHGIIGSAEVLQDQGLDEFSESMVHQISTCGRSLAQIVENLLDFSDLSHGAKHGTRGPRKDVLNGLKLPKSGSMMQDSTLLDEVTEEVVESSIMAYLYNRRFDVNRSVTTILDITRPGHVCWNTKKIDAGGWKRICMNLVTNALKCTANGHIYVGLRTEPSEQTGRCNAVLSVQDTGKGMSKAFVQNDLFAAFSQEDSFLEGTGLGMHIVARIVKSFNGKIDVRTDQSGGGTRITVVIPLESGPPDPKADTSLAMLDPFRGITAGIITSEIISSTTSDSDARELQLKTLAQSCNEMGIQTTVVDRKTRTNTTHLNIITEEDLLNCFQQWDSEPSHDLKDTIMAKPLVVLCCCIYSEKALRLYMDGVFLDQVVGYVVQPCGPRRLHGIMLSLLEKQRAAQANAPYTRLANVTVGAADVSKLAVRNSMPIRAHTAGSTNVRDETKFSVLSGSVEDSSTTVKDSGLVIMVVEDNKINLQLLRTFARKQGVTCIAAENGKLAFEAYKLAHEESRNDTSEHAVSHRVPSVILMDINMPVMNGFEATQAIRGYERKHGLQAAKIIALTGLGSEEAQREAYTSGCDMFLSKPVSLKDLTKILNGFEAPSG